MNVVFLSCAIRAPGALLVNHRRVRCVEMNHVARPLTIPTDGTRVAAQHDIGCGVADVFARCFVELGRKPGFGAFLFFAAHGAIESRDAKPLRLQVFFKQID